MDLTLIFLAWIFLPLLLGFLRNPNRQWIPSGSERAIIFAGSPAKGLFWGLTILLLFSAWTLGACFLASGEPGVVQYLAASFRDTGMDSVVELADNPMSHEFTMIRFFLSAYLALLSLQFAIIIWTLASFDKSCIKLTERGIRFPLRYYFSLKKQLIWNWKDLTAIKLNENKWLELEFVSGSKARINLAEIAERDRELLIYTALRQNPDSAFIKNKTLSDRNQFMANKEMASFTELWNDRYRRQIRSTTFIPLSTGENILANKYSIIQQLTSSAMSATYAGRDKDGHSVIIKELATGSMMQSASKTRELFLRECSILAKIKHDQICKILDTFSESDRDYLVLEYIPGKTLRKYRETQGSLNDRNILEIAMQMCEILQYLHEQEPPIIHRDLTPENWIIDNNGRVFLIDFGVANHYLSDLTRTIVGKNAYMAPEQVRGKAGFQSDVYAIGATLYHLVTGEDPEALSECAIPLRHQNASSSLPEIILECTRQDSNLRVQSAIELRKLLERAIDNMEQGNLSTAQKIKLKFQEPLKMLRPKS